MPQYNFGTIDPNSKSGSQLAVDLNNWRDAIESLHRGSARPSYLRGGSLWVKDATTTWELYLFDGAEDALLGTVDTVLNTFTPANDATLRGLIAAACQRSANLSDVANPGTALSNLGGAKAGAIGSSGLTQATARLLGRTTAGVGAPEEISVGAGLTLTGGSLACTVTSPVSSVGGYTGAVTAGQLLAAIEAVDGSGSGLDADTLDGNHASAFATSGHTHTGFVSTDAYSAVGGIRGSMINPDWTVGATTEGSNIGFGSGTWRHCGCTSYALSGDGSHDGAIWQRIA